MSGFSSVTKTHGLRPKLSSQKIHTIPAGDGEEIEPLEFSLSGCEMTFWASDPVFFVIAADEESAIAALTEIEEPEDSILRNCSSLDAGQSFSVYPDQHESTDKLYIVSQAGETTANMIIYEEK